MLKIRLMRIGTKKRPFYRVVVVDERNKRTGSYIDLIGTYNPLTNPKEIILDQAKIDDWTKKGAQPSHGFLRILGKAPQKPPRKPKKVREEKKVAPAPEVNDAPAEETPVTEEVTSETVAIESNPTEVVEVVAESAPEETPAATEEVIEAEPVAEEIAPETSEKTPAEGETK